MDETARDLSRLPDKQVAPQLHTAMRGHPAMIQLGGLRMAPAMPQSETDEEGPEPVAAKDLPEETDIATGALTPRPGKQRISVDSKRSAPMPVEGIYSRVVGECLERLGMLARHRDERALRERTYTETRMLAQLDAIAAAGATTTDVLTWWEAEYDEDPWTLWGAVFVLGAAHGPKPLLAILDLAESFPDDAVDLAVMIAEPLVVSPHPDVIVLGRDLLASRHPIACAAGIELLSRRGLLSPPVEVRHASDARPTVASAALRALARRDGPEPDLLAAARRRMGDEDPLVAWEAARALTLWGLRDALDDLRADRSLAGTLGARALDVLVLGGSLDDVAIMQQLLGRLPCSWEVLDAVARFGHARAWSYLVQHLDDRDMAEGARHALSTLFGELVPVGNEASSAAVRDALARAELSSAVRYRRGREWSEQVVLSECRSGLLTRNEVELRLDELRARGRSRISADLGIWGVEAALPTHLDG